MVDNNYVKLSKLEYENSQLKAEVKRLEDVIVFLRSNLADIGVKIEHTQQKHNSCKSMETITVDYITIPEQKIAVVKKPTMKELGWK